MKKKALSLVLALVMFLGLCVPVSAVSGDFIIDNGILIYYNGSGGDVVIPDGVTTIGHSAFWGCTGLTSITIPNSVTTIEYGAFCQCSNLTSVTIPNSVTSIGDTVFNMCTSLTSVTIPPSVTSIGLDAFDGTPWLKNQGEFIIVNGILLTYKGSSGNVVIPSSVTSIGNGAFSDRSDLTGVTIPSGVTSIGENAFGNCYRLTDVILPSGVTSIGVTAFSGCYGLTSVTIPSGVTSIDIHTFSTCHGLTNVTIPSGVTSIGDFAFYKCDSLVDVYYGGTKTQWDTIQIGTNNEALTNATIHYNSNTGTTTQPQQPAGSTASNGAQVSGWAKDRVNVALDNALAPDGLGNDYRVNITRAQFAATAVKLYEAMSGQKAEATGESSFTDTTDPVILLAADLGFVSGVGGGKFSPDALVTREQAAVMLSSVYTRLGGEIPAVASTTFADNGDVSGWAKSAVAFMNGKEIVTGVGNNSFSPKGNASIEQALLISLKMFETLK